MSAATSVIVACLRRTVAALCCGVSLGAASAAVAVQDPMRPTPGAAGASSRAAAPEQREPSAGEAAPAAPAAGSVAAPAPSPRDPLRLVSIRREQGSAPKALIGEQWVGTGDRVEGWRVTGVDTEEVRLQRGDEKVALRLWPQLRPVKAEPPAAPAAAPARARPQR